jgi:hypothetical protein
VNSKQQSPGVCNGKLLNHAFTLVAEPVFLAVGAPSRLSSFLRSHRKRKHQFEVAARAACEGDP